MINPQRLEINSKIYMGREKILYSVLNCVIKKFLNAENFGTLKKFFWHNLIVDNQNMYCLLEKHQRVHFGRGRANDNVSKIRNLFYNPANFFFDVREFISNLWGIIPNLWGFILDLRGFYSQPLGIYYMYNVHIWHGDM